MPSLKHLIELSDDVGLIQHALEDVPNRATGYCTDDVSRALIVVLAKLNLDPQDASAERLASVYLAFLRDAQLPDGRFHNFMSYAREWLDSVGTHDSVGRALWSLGYAMRYAPRDSWRRVAKSLFGKGLAATEWLRYPRSQAYAAIGLAHACAAIVVNGEVVEYRRILRVLAEGLKDLYLQTRDAGWHWFENVMTYDNARLPEAMLRAGLALRDDELTAIGLRTFDFYVKTTVEDGIFVPIGNEGWYPRGGTRARHSQQPLEAAALVDAAIAAYESTGSAEFQRIAQIGLEWYYGRNSRGIVMALNGGCLDGMNEQTVNMNMGAESTLAFLAAAYALGSQPETRPAAIRSTTIGTVITR